MRGRPLARVRSEQRGDQPVKFGRNRSPQPVDGEWPGLIKDFPRQEQVKNRPKGIQVVGDAISIGMIQPFRRDETGRSPDERIGSIDLCRALKVYRHEAIIPGNDEIPRFAIPPGPTRLVRL